MKSPCKMAVFTPNCSIYCIILNIDAEYIHIIVKVKFVGIEVTSKRKHSNTTDIRIRITNNTVIV